MKNSKLAKGIIAGGLGLALLMGGGTFALWNQTAVQSASVQTGELNFTMQDGQWSVAAADIDRAAKPSFEKIEKIDSFHMVPGDTLQYTTIAKIKAVGDTLKARFAVNWGDIASNDERLLKAMISSDKTTVRIGDDSKPSPGMRSAVFEVNPSDAKNGVIEVPVTYTLHFPATSQGDSGASIKDPKAWWGGEAQNTAINFNDVTFSLTQDLGQFRADS